MGLPGALRPDADARWLDPKLKPLLWRRYKRLTTLLAEIKMQCSFIITAADLLSRATPGSHEQVWFAIHSMLVAAANVSKLAWGAGNRDLREVCGLTGASPLRDRDLRTDFEHFEQRCVEWERTTTLGNYVGRFIGQFEGPVGNKAFAGPGFDRNDVFFAYDPTTGEVSFWNHSAFLPAFVQEGTGLLARTAEREKAPFWTVTKPWKLSTDELNSPGDPGA
jgi:hypothetical protein